jgi:hypothetical protein
LGTRPWKWYVTQIATQLQYDTVAMEVEGDADERLAEGDNVPDGETLVEGDTVAAGTEADRVTWDDALLLPSVVGER